MKHKFRIRSFALAAILAATFGLAACGDGGNLPAQHEHTFSTAWSSDEEFHWHAATCGHASVRSGEAAHTFVYSNKTEEGHTGTCSICGKIVTEEHDYQNGVCTDCNYEHKTHTLVYSNKTEEGHTGTCSICGKIVTEEHDYQNGVCTDCNYEHKAHTLVYSNKTEEGHTGTCSVCKKVVTEEHDYQSGVCTNCNYEHAEHTFVYSNKTEEGHTGTCSVCGKVVTKEHDYQSGVCTECKYEHQNHDYQNGVCTECYYRHQNHEYGDDNLCDVCGTRLYTKNADGTISFGEYPQTEVKEGDLKASLGWEAGATPTSSDAGKWTDYGYYIEGSVQSYMWYIDVEYQGSRYRGVYFTSYRPYWTTISSSTSNSYQDDNGYYGGTAYWFKYEPIEWRILEQKDGTALLMANIILDSQQYYRTDSGTRTVNGKTVYPNNYKESDIRAWLTETFYQTAFDEFAQQIIETTTVDNSASSTASNSNSYACENTEDKVFLLSYLEVLNTSYGFSSSFSDDDTARQLKSTDYAKSQGIKDVLMSRGGNYGVWWLRSPDYNHSDRAWHVDPEGDACYGVLVCYTSLGVVPALRIRL